MKSSCKVVCLVFFMVFATVTASRAETLATVGANVRVNDPQQLPEDDWPNRNTPSLAASDDGQRLLAGFEDFQGFCGPPNNRPCPAPAPPGLTGFAYSTDGGHTWTDAGTVPPIDDAESAGHPWVDRGGDPRHEVYYLVTRSRVGLPPVGIGAYSGRFTKDGTFVWRQSHLLSPPNPNDNYSRPAVAAAKDGSGSAYVVLSNIIEVCGIPGFGLGQIEVWRTHDKGATWQGPVVAGPDTIEVTDPEDPLCGVLGALQVAPAITVGPRGEVYLVWQRGPRFIDVEGNTGDSSEIVFARSVNGGRTFSRPRVLAEINANYKNTPVGHGKSRQNDQPRIAVANSGPHRGRVYVTFYQPVTPVDVEATEQSAVSSQIYITWSDDRGRTWNTPRALTAPVPPTGVKRFWPTVSVRPEGDVDVVYLESLEKQATEEPNDTECAVPIGGGLVRTGPLSSLVDTYWIQSRDGGSTFGAPLRVSKRTSNWCSTYYTFSNPTFSNYGDYLGSASVKNRTFVLWPDGRNGVTDLFFAKVKGRTKPGTGDAAGEAEVVEDEQDE